MSDHQEQDHFRHLIQAANAGCNDAAQELYKTYGKHVLRCIRVKLWQRMRPSFDSQDFEQQVWASFFHDRGQLPDFQSPQDLIAYLRDMACKKVKVEGRRQHMAKRNLARATRIDESSNRVGQHPASRLPTPSAVMIGREEYDRLVDSQTGQTREVALLRAEGNSYEEIGQTLKIDEATARKEIRGIRRRDAANPQDN